ncbi:hypothetical protein TNCV_1257511 [Trichonephila clavipes]|nr:hypothetical protein TNCV_1257511 [Trichonephila clavipes]
MNSYGDHIPLAAPCGRGSRVVWASDRGWLCHGPMLVNSSCKTTHPVKGLMTLTAASQGLGANPGKSMDVCNCIIPLRHGGTLKSRRATSLLVRSVEGEERWVAPDHL